LSWRLVAKEKAVKIEGKLTSESLAALIVDALFHAGLVAKENTEKAIDIAAEEIEVRKSAGDY
jgi:hypothetical protein